MPAEHAPPVPQNLPFRGRGVLVTGASGRLGRAIALRLAEAGADVAVHYRGDEQGAAETVAACEEHGVRATALAADLVDEAACRSLVEAAEEAVGDLALLVNNAAIFERTPLETMDADDFDRHMTSNARTVYLLSLHAGRRMKARGKGAIVNITGVAGLRPWAGYVPYSASKAAAVNLTRGFARLLAPEVRVNAVAPGPILPPKDAAPERNAAAVAATLLGRWGHPDDITAAVLFLATSPYVTGVVLPVDGGRSIA